MEWLGDTIPFFVYELKNSEMRIPFAKNTLGEEEKKALADVIDSGWVVMGEQTERFEKEFAQYVGAQYAVFVDSGTSALFLALQYLKIQDSWKRVAEVEIPSLTFVATAEAVVNAGFGVRFMDVEKERFCMNEVGQFSLPVHLLGNRAEKGAMIYDSAHRIEKDDYKNTEKVGGVSPLWCYSFYATKNMTTVQGGMIVTHDQEAYDWLRSARDHGLNHGTKERYLGKYKKSEAGFVGWRVKGDDLRAVIGLEQLKKLPEMTQRRNEIVQRYNDALGLSNKGNHVYPVLVNEREKFLQQMNDAGVQCVVHFSPVHLMKAYKNFSRNDLVNTEYIGDRIVSLPIFPQMTDDEVDYVSEKIISSKLLIV